MQVQLAASFHHLLRKHSVGTCAVNPYKPGQRAPFTHVVAKPPRFFKCQLCKLLAGGTHVKPRDVAACVQGSHSSAEPASR